MLGYSTATIFFLLLVWGNLVAGMHAGMACPDWPLCQGKLLPPLVLDVWMEYLHRLLAVVATVTLLFLGRQRWRDYRNGQRAIPLTALGLIAIQIVIGGIVVLLQLPVQVTTLHFITGLALFVLVLYMAFCDGKASPPLFSVRGYAGLLFSLTFLILAQAFLGAYLRHSGASFACTGFFSCQGSLFPDIWDSHLAVNYAHRILAVALLVTSALLLGLAYRDRHLKLRPVECFILFTLILLQLGVGMGVVESGFNFEITGMHLAVALSAIWFAVKLWLEQIARTGSESP